MGVGGRCRSGGRVSWRQLVRSKGLRCWDDQWRCVPGNESIKQLETRYCSYLDAKDWESWRGLIADDFVSDLDEAGGGVIVGADQFVTYTRRTIGKPTQSTVHQVTLRKSS